MSSLTEGVSTRSAGSRITIITDDAIWAPLSIGCCEAICIRHSCSTWNLFLLKICGLNCRSTFEFWPSVVQRSLLIAAWIFPFLGLSCWRWVHNHHGRCQSLQFCVDFVFVYVLCCCVFVFVFVFVIVIVLPAWAWIIKEQFWVGMRHVGVLWHMSKFHLQLRTVVI